MLPVWHQQSSPFWEVIGADALLPHRQGKDRPTQGALIKANARGAIRLAWWAPLVQEPGVVDRLGERMLAALWTTDDNERTEVAQRIAFRRPSPLVVPV